MNIGIMISGKGSNMLNIVKACENGTLNATVKIVISNNPSEGIAKAKKIGIPTKIIETKNFKSKLKFENEITKILKLNEVSIVCLAGFMKTLSKKFVNKWEKRLINVHPSLLPSFKGLNAQLQAIKKGVKYAGCTIHYVSSEIDDGEILDQSVVKVNKNDTEKTLSKKILIEEHKLYIRVLKNLINKELV
mgnify:FL=1|tara:strand:+ start:61 stop:630 length:570 start_codon:yes stop_codon:yes gene_type:complete